MPTRYALPGGERDENGEARYWIDVPEEWLVRHDEAARESLQAADEAKIESGTIRAFLASLEVLDDWRLPGLEGKQDGWNVDALTTELVAWVTFHGWTSLQRAKQVKKNWFLPFAIGQEDESSEAEAVGTSGATT